MAAVKSFNLTRYFVVTSFFMILFVTVGMAALFGPLMRQQMLAEGEDDALSLAVHVKREAEPALLALLAEPDSQALRDQLAPVLSEHLSHFDVVLVRLYDSGGRPIFSNADENLDFSLTGAVGLEQAWAGQAWAEYKTSAEIPKAHVALSLPAHIVETYLPVYAADGRQVVGVFEIYRDVTEDYGRARQLQYSAALTVTLAMGGLFAALALIVRRGDRLLAETSSRFGDVLATSADAIICADESGCITLWNEAAARMFGYSTQEALGRSYTQLMAPEAREQFESRFLPPPGDTFPRLPAAPLVSLATRRDGTTFPVEISVSAHRKGSGYEFSAVLRDITKRMRAKAALEAANEELARAAGRAHELAFAADEANRAKTEFLANTSHELRTPLTAIIGFLQIINDDLCDTPEEAREFVQSALDSANHLHGVVNDVLDITRVEAGRLEISLERVRLADVLGEVQRAADLQAQRNGLTLRFDHPPDLYVQADPARLRQVLLNLVSNAIKFTRTGEVSVSARPAPDADYALIEITDTGIGIAPAFLPYAFDKFSQADGSMSRGHAGAGLGLAITRGLVEMMHGQVGLESAGEGSGARAWLTLPVAVNDE